jgi:hypothetical protein
MGKNTKIAILKFAVIYFFTYNCYKSYTFSIISSRKTVSAAIVIIVAFSEKL